MKFLQLLSIFTFLLFSQTMIFGQATIKGKVTDDGNGDDLIGASIVIEGTGVGTVTDYDGTYNLKIKEDLPVNVVFSYIGYEDKVVTVTESTTIDITLGEAANVLETAVVKTQRISDKQKAAPLTVESLDILAIKETTSDNFYDGLGALKGVDVTAASLGFKVINTRGFNSTSPVRSLQIIDGVDNQSPGLNFSLGNFLGSSELDVQKVDIIVGASSAFYGPNAFNGVIAMETKNPFIHKGLAGSIKVGERNMVEGAFRYADSAINKDGKEFFAYKVNFSYLRADDWEATNYDAVFDEDNEFNDVDSPGGYDAVNRYGDEYLGNLDLSGSAETTPFRIPGLREWHRTGYNEIDLVDYNTRNLKTAAAFHFRLNPDKGLESSEFIAAGNFSTGTTVYQGDNRFSLKDIAFWQTRLELRKKGKYFLRAYYTDESSGNSYDPYLTALILQRQAKTNADWGKDYLNYWRLQGDGQPETELRRPVEEGGFGFPGIVIENGMVQPYDFDAAAAWYQDPTNLEALRQFHADAVAVADMAGTGASVDRFEPGTARFDEKFNEIRTTLNANDGLLQNNGSALYDRSALYHVHGEYNFAINGLEYLKVGANSRLYTPDTRGTVFADTGDVVITNWEVGAYVGAEKKFFNDKLALSATIRGDKNQNFNVIATPAASIVYKPKPGSFLRASFSAAVRNPTLADQYLDLNVGPATLRGNLNGVQDLVTVESFNDYRKSQDPMDLDSFDIRAVRPERVKTAEIGYRTTLWNKVYVDAGYYFSIYDDFLGFNIGLVPTITDNILQDVDAFRYSANSENQVTTQGFSIGLSYYLWNYFQLNGNYSWNKLNVEFDDDPIIPAFNTPEHKFNLGFSGRNIQAGRIKGFGFNVNYKWVEGFLFEGSPQFTGLIPSYGLLNVQINKTFPKANLTAKLGASNVLNNEHFEAYGGPLIGRLAYLSFTYDFKKLD
jgi:outer membrane receptor protein involved in Fe transport